MKFSIYQSIPGVYIVKPKMPGFILPSGENIIPVVNEMSSFSTILSRNCKYYIPRYLHLFKKMKKPQRYVLGRMLDIREVENSLSSILWRIKHLESLVITTINDNYPYIWCNVPIYIPSTISESSFSSRVKFISEVEVDYRMRDYWEAEFDYNSAYYDFIQRHDPYSVMRNLVCRYIRWDIEMFRFYQILYRKGLYK